MDEQFAIDVLSGRRRGMIPTALRAVCRAASWGYAAAMTVRNAGYDYGWLKTHRIDCPVISIGNITTGGTGKTPLVAWFAQRLQHAGYRPGILSRGYRSLHSATSPSPCATGSASVFPMVQSDCPDKQKTLAEPVAHNGANDEALVLERLCPGVPQVAMRDRVAGADIAIQQRGCDALVLDDGFQHRRLARDLDVVLIDALQPWGYGHLLPRGLLREPLSALKRADVVIITRADQIAPDMLHELRTHIARVRGVDEHIAVRFAPKRLINALGDTQHPGCFFAAGVLSSNSAATEIEHPGCQEAGMRAFCGIGNPDGFRRTLLDLGITGELKTFPDHHHYTRADLDAIGEWGATRSVTEFATTLKDLVKIPTDHPLASHIWAVEIVPEFVAGEQILLERLYRFVPRLMPSVAA